MSAPPVSASVDLRDFAFMPLDVVRLRDSDLAAIASGDAFRAAVMLWCAAWHQVPAASLPTDDRMLARFAGYGRDVAAWAEVKADALRGFVECDDGRLYHPVIAEKAIEAWAAKEAQRARTAAATAARARQRDGERDVQRDVPPEDDRNVHQGTGTGIGTVEGKPSQIEKQKTRGREVDPISEDWGPSQADRDFAELEGLPAGDVEREAGGFRDHWLRSGEPQADWSAAWRGWVREAIKRRRKGGGRGGGSNGSSGAPAAPGHVGERMVDLGVGRFSERLLRETWARGEWRSFWGPKPGERGCKVPEAVFQEAG